MAKKKAAATAEGDEEKKKKGGKTKIIVIVACVALGAGGYVLGGGGAADPAAAAVATTTTLYQKPGCTGLSADEAPLKVVDIPSLSINLADGHYLRVSVSLGLCDDVIVTEAEPFITAPAKDIVVETLSGKSMETLATDAGREAVKEKLNEEILAAYPAEVFEVFLVEFVMQ